MASNTLDWTAYRDLRPVVADALERPQAVAVHVDLSRVVALEPAGIGALVVLSQMAARRDKTLVLDHVPPRFDTVLRDCGLAVAGPPRIAEAVEAAAAAMRKQGSGAR